ncbi:hypothetical protein L873DRAFT_1798279 [Choiromyces venosus 120613-1]|uniref:Uncharacterized protein n=1 Tax=Choiromyces venosus 120613-1 TaxID=1336337 RepID=A0A3N4K3X3_9PEZI|nr:hypothetical protein L873DRAFT_1798279 [Choiromyces venosus 120613-1]
MARPQLQYCILCCFLSKACIRTLSSNIDGSTSTQPTCTPSPFQPTLWIRQTLFVCSYCEISGFQVPLHKDFCFNLFHIMD